VGVGGWGGGGWVRVGSQLLPSEEGVAQDVFLQLLAPKTQEPEPKTPLCPPARGGGEAEDRLGCEPWTRPAGCQGDRWAEVVAGQVAPLGSSGELLPMLGVAQSWHLGLCFPGSQSHVNSPLRQG
jgi:hypothetical protein